MEHLIFNPQGTADAADPACPDCSVLTMAFVNMQPFTEGYDPSKAFTRGTLWEDLDKPWEVTGFERKG